MTRINAGIKAADLHSKHLLAEHREIKRIPNLIKSGRFNDKDTPTEFKLGTGHVKFFYRKQKYLYKRYLEIYKECINRGFKVENYSECWDGFSENLNLLFYWQDWEPTEEAKILIRERINERINLFKK